MHLHEYQAKELLEKEGFPLLPRYVIATPEDLKSVPLESGVVKVQIHAGGRGKAGGVKIAKTKEELKAAVKELLGLKITTKQTGPEGMVAEKLLIEPLSSIQKEYYVSALIDRKSGKALLIASTEGGMEIEEVAEQQPEKIVQVPIERDGTLRGYHLIRLCKALGLGFGKNDEAPKMFRALAKAFVQSDASLIEINPLAMTEEGKLIALDAKMSIDDNALFRQLEIADFYDAKQVPEREAMAHKHELAYIAMEGSIGCMVNGAGLAMATMDIIKSFGGAPANFLDVGGSADVEKVATGFEIILQDPAVQGILVNIFGGIMNCKTIAEGVIAAVHRMGISVPLVVRLEGTNVEEGRALLKGSGLKIISATTLADAAEKIVKEVASAGISR